MIVAETNHGYQFVTQPDHAALAGQFADRWGTDRFDEPTPRGPLRIAAYNHDLGWWTYDRRPHLDTEGEPIDFRGMDTQTWIDLYETGIDAVVELDAYAGLLVSLHGAGLRRRRYGLSPSWPETPRSYTSFVRRQEALQTRLLDDLLAAEDASVSAEDRDVLSALHESGSAPDGTDSRLWYNYRLLQAWDTLSLGFCTTATPPHPSSVAPVPTGPGEADTELTISGLGEGEFGVDPYPFETSPLVATVPSRTVRRAEFDDEASLVRAYYRAEREMTEFTFRVQR